MGIVRVGEPAAPSPDEPPREVKAFDPETLSYEDRHQVGGLFASLVDATGVDGERAPRVLKTHFRYLGLTSAAQDALIPLARGHHDPTRCAAAIRKDKTRWMTLWDLLAPALVDRCYDARDRERIRRIAAALGGP
jgi:hypothetical protein